MMAGQQPIIVLKEGTKREQGKGAQANNIAAARAISEAVKHGQKYTVVHPDSNVKFDNLNYLIVL